MRIEEKIKKLALEKGAHHVGIASKDRLAEAPKGHRPEDYFKGTKSLISIAMRIPRSPIENLPKTRRPYHMTFDVVSDRLNDCAYEIALFLEREGFPSLHFPVGPPYEVKLFGDISNRHVAVAAGIGEFGANALFLSPEFGPRMRLCTIATSLDLEPDPLSDKKICTYPECIECIKACPVEAFGTSKKLDPIRGIEGNPIKEKCHYYQNVTLNGLRCGQCIRACPVGKDPGKEERSH